MFVVLRVLSSLNFFTKTIQQTCFGKHNSEYLLLCDYCDQESHTYCLTPQLVEIPEEAWYCRSCINQGYVKTEVTASTEDNSTLISSSSSTSASSSNSSSDSNSISTLAISSTEDMQDSCGAVASLEGFVHPTHRHARTSCSCTFN